MYLVIQFQEAYKRLDKLCKDYLGSNEGVSEYIRQMEATPWVDYKHVSTWERDYRQLKHVRWVRNKLAHDVGTLNSDICVEDDLLWVEDFYNRIMKGCDPFTIIRTAKKSVVDSTKYKKTVSSSTENYSTVTTQKPTTSTENHSTVTTQKPTPQNRALKNNSPQKQRKALGLFMFIMLFVLISFLAWWLFVLLA